MTINDLPAAVPSVFDAGLPRLDYAHSHDPEEAHRVLAEARRHAPIALGPFGPETLTYELARIVLRDPRFGAAHRLITEAQGLTSGSLWQRISNFIPSIDGERHLRLRRLVAKAFTPRSVARLQPLIVEIINELLEPHLAVGRCDIVSDVAEQFPIPIICALLGTPRSDWRLFSTWAADLKKMFDWNLVNDEGRILAAWDAIDDYLEGMVARRREQLTDDLMSDLIRAEEDGDRLAHDELLSLAVALLGAGTDTTRNQLASAIELFCDHPDQWTLFGDHPEMAPRVVEEVMRHRPIGFGAPRVATEDVELAGVNIPAGTIIFVNTAAANRDPAAFREPERFDITRDDNTPGMLSFGYGVHVCLGAHLARLELTQALTVMAQRMPNLRRTGASPWPSMMLITGPSTVPVAFGPDYHQAG
ncbi:cytochrome P450 [Mycobacterium sp. 1245852.3]|uniref:cytochrome P450 n=1 Tax=Mycobacterium sp. 1245852.3 TaxID=1856860 RepID=UPI0007FE8B9C|nr:cytochrome P450 [Mycobacterium sp. 1245852.3]OBJ90438.1 cytochrome [Mycobacterium sp. 1245852.3]